MKKTNFLTFAFAIIAIIMGLLYFLKSKTSLTNEQVKFIETALKSNPDYFSTYSMKDKFNELVKDTASAKKNVLDYRSKVSVGVASWISYNSDSIRKYLNTFDSFKKLYTTPKNMKWEIGFYPYFKSGQNIDSTDFYVIPTLVDIKNPKGNCIDMFAPSNNVDKIYFDTASALLYDYGDLHP